MTDADLIKMLTDGLISVAPDRKASFQGLTLQKSIEELGLDSIAAMELVSYLEEQTGLMFPDEDLATVRTLGDLAALVRNAS
jgi:aryl carrier-like protein